MSINLKTNERVFITGKTGSGKTYLAHYLTRACPRLVVLDGKGTLAPWNLEPWDPETRDKLRQGEPIKIRAVLPWKADPALFWPSVLYEIYQAGNVTVYTDEMYIISPPGKPIPDMLWALYTRGRELGIGMWGSSQRPAWIPLFCMSESEHYFMFRLQLDDDKKRMSEFMGKGIFPPIRDEHGFYYSRAEWDEPGYFKQLEVKDNAKTIEISKGPGPVSDLRRTGGGTSADGGRRKHFDLPALRW